MTPSAGTRIARRAAEIAVLSLLAFPVANVRAQEANPLPGARVLAVRATSACFSSMIRVVGFLVAREEAVVTLDAPGYRVTELLVAEGDRVTAGQELIKLVRQTVEGQDNAAAARNLTLKSPAAGLVTRSTAAVGWASGSPLNMEPLLRIAVGDTIELEIDVPSIRVPEISTGQTARITLEGGRQLTGRVRLVPAEIDRRTQLGRARLSLERDPLLKIGLFARAAIDANRSCGISVPRSAVQYKTEGTSVQVVNGGVIETRLVQVGLHSDTDIEIRDGVRDGDIVVGNTGTSLRDGEKVIPVFVE